MRVLLLGGSGQLGSEIRARWSGDEIVAPPHAAFDLFEPERFADAIAAASPELVVNCAAFHNVDECEHAPERALAANAIAVDALGAICAQRDIALLTISTDYVFDGDANRPYREDDCARPISAYGVSKLAGELLALRRGGNAYVVRTCGVYGLHASRSKGTFVDRVIAQARAGEPIRVVNDVVASPTYAGHLALALRALVETRAYGLYHAANVGPVSWYDFAAKALELAGIAHPIEPISASAWKAAARRPAYSALANAKLERLGIRLPRWDEGVAAYIQDKGL
ncbi:MAG: dTDP-4-dehydrorhamnose reductase [bacterium]|nr:dTDP-4-dehydrorhamnose reductase [bacterium]